MNKFRELTIGKILYGKYVIEKVLGVGGFGITYYAKHTTLNKHYAVKEFFINGFCVRNTQTKDVHLQGITDEEYAGFREKFVEEAQTLAKLDHENIVKVIDMFEENNTSYIVMPFVEGVTLQQLVKQKGKLDYETAVNYMAQIAEAIGYIHERNILHRDISPDNVIVTPANKIVLIDFGSAREFIHDKTQSHTAILKKGYAPLEQYSVTSRKGAYSDIYSLGAVFYFALTGKKPTEATERTMDDSMPEPKSLDASIPDDANRTILKAMALKPEYRHQNIKEFMDDLLGEKPSKPVRLKPSKSNMKKKILFASGVLTVILAAIIFGVLFWENSGNKTVPETVSETAFEIKQNKIPDSVSDMQFNMHGRIFTYTGEVKANSEGALEPHGAGKATYETGKIETENGTIDESACTYEGQFSEGYRSDGILQFSNGDSYKGRFEKNLMQGEGTYYFSDGKSIVGEFKNNVPKECSLRKGSVVLGDYINGKYKSR
jgi:serine/threonine protein kinase